MSAPTYHDKHAARKVLRAKLAIIFADTAGRKREMEENAELHGDSDNPVVIMWKEMREVKQLLGLGNFPTAKEVEDAMRELL